MVSIFEHGGRERLDDPHLWRPQTTHKTENIKRVLLKKENDITEASINHFTIHEIIQNAFKNRKRPSHWISHEFNR
jgi:DNA-binding TFAR19-related protein (PDSD5 family)